MKKVISLLIILVLVIVDTNLFKGSFDSSQKLKDLSGNDIRLSDLKAENDSLKKSLAEKDSSFFVEKEARDKLGLEKNGETTIVITDKTLGAETNKIAVVIKTNPEKWFYLVTH